MKNLIKKNFQADIKTNLQNQGNEFYKYILVWNGLKIQVDKIINRMADNKELPDYYMSEYNRNPQMLDVLADMYKDLLIIEMNEIEG